MKAAAGPGDSEVSTDDSIPLHHAMKVVGAVGILNLPLYVFIAMGLHGSALGGYTANGRYFLANHRTFIAVSEGVYLYSKWHGISVCVTFPLSLLLAFLVQRQRRAV